jgi:hypothetical protein
MRFLADMQPNQVNHYLAQIITEHQKALDAGAIISVTDKRARVRLLPI